jgi:transposase
MRRDVICSYPLSNWRRQREAADLAALTPKPRGTHADPHRAETPHVASLTRERDKLQSRPDKAQLATEVQKEPAA